MHDDLVYLGVIGRGDLVDQERLGDDQERVGQARRGRSLGLARGRRFRGNAGLLRRALMLDAGRMRLLEIERRRAQRPVPKYRTCI
jgi:hypothetical protein